MTFRKIADNVITFGKQVGIDKMHLDKVVLTFQPKFNATKNCQTILIRGNFLEVTLA